VGASCYVLSCQALNGATSQGPDSSGAYLVVKPPGVTAEDPDAC
jgi:hypothetical protein